MNCCSNPAIKDSGCDSVCDNCGTIFWCNGSIKPGTKAPLRESFLEEVERVNRIVFSYPLPLKTTAPVVSTMYIPPGMLSDHTIPFSQQIRQPSQYIDINELPDDLRKQVQEWLRSANESKK